MPRAPLKIMKNVMPESDDDSDVEMDEESDGSEMESFDEDASFDGESGDGSVDEDDEDEDDGSAAEEEDDGSGDEVEDAESGVEEDGEESAGEDGVPEARVIPTEEDDGDDDDEERMLDLDDDEELQLAFAKGILKPGLNAIGVDTKKTYTNDPAGLETKLKSFKMSLPWIEVLSMTVKPAALAPELALEEEEHAQKRLKMFEARMAKKVSKGKKGGAVMEKSMEADAVHNDFKREVGFYRLAQAAVLQGIPKLKTAGAKTKKPVDYFAEMAKSDEHMQRVRHKLLDEERRAEESAKARRLRELKKFGKQTQVAVLQRRNEEKKQLMEQIKKFRKGQKDALNFLDEPGGKPGAGQKEKKERPVSTRKSRNKRMSKDMKYGFGGQKKRSKYNTKASADDVGGFMPLRGGRMGEVKKGSFKGVKSNPGAKPKFKPGKSSNRPGKGRRQQMKAKKR